MTDTTNASTSAQRIADLTASCYAHIAEAQESGRQHQRAREDFRASAEDFRRFLDSIEQEA